MGRVLAIDYGNKRVGLAVTDPLQIISTKLDTVPAHDIFNYLSTYFKKETVDEIVVGYPKKLNNQPSESVKYINPFVAKLKDLYPDKRVVFMDERFTSKMAFQAMIDGGLGKKQRRNKEIIDTVSAVILLQSYLELKQHNKNT